MHIGCLDVDLVFCIDATNSMTSHLDEIKAGIRNFQNQLHEECQNDTDVDFIVINS